MLRKATVMLACLLLAACHTTEGVKQDVKVGAEVAGEAIHKGGESVGKALQKSGEFVEESIKKGGEAVKKVVD